MQIQSPKFKMISNSPLAKGLSIKRRKSTKRLSSHSCKNGLENYQLMLSLLIVSTPISYHELLQVIKYNNYFKSTIYEAYYKIKGKKLNVH